MPISITGSTNISMLLLFLLIFLSFTKEYSLVFKEFNLSLFSLSLISSEKLNISLVFFEITSPLFLHFR